MAQRKKQIIGDQTGLSGPQNVVKGNFESEATDTSHVGLAFWYLRKVGSADEALAALEAAIGATKILKKVRARRKKEAENTPLLEEIPCGESSS